MRVSLVYLLIFFNYGIMTRHNMDALSPLLTLCVHGRQWESVDSQNEAFDSDL